MSTTTCPNCGKPLRPGTKFCGNCGSTLPAVSPPKPIASSTERDFSSSRKGSGTCPHCGKPLRAGARFCNVCGKSISEGIQSLTADEQATRPSPPPVGTKPVPPLQGPGARPTTYPTPDQKPARKRVWIGFFLSLASIACVLVMAAAYIYLNHPFGWLEKPTSTTVSSEVTITEETIQTPLAGITPTIRVTVEPVVITESPTVITPSIETPSSLTTITTILSTTTELISTPVTPTTSGPVEILFEDNFVENINTNWMPWGVAKYYPSIQKSPTGNWLSLCASEVPGSAGVTAKQDMLSTEGVEIVFEAQLNPDYPQFRLIFDWDPLNDPRTEKSKVLGLVHFEIRTDKMILKDRFNKSTCIRPINGAEKNKYHIRFTENQGVHMFVEGSSVESCTIPNIGQPASKGKITFTGMGWVMFVRVTRP